MLELPLLLALILASDDSPASSWPQYAGPLHDRTSPAAIEVRDWKGGAPTAWKVGTPGGFSSFVVADGRAYTLVSRDGGEALVALDAATGAELWAFRMSSVDYDRGGDAGADDAKGGDGPRTTPAVADGRVVVLDAGLVLAAVDAGTGEEVWRSDLVEEYDARPIRWQNGASPLVDGGLVFCVGGGEGRSLLAFDAETGDLAWATGSESMTHATPVVAELSGVRQVIFLVQYGLVAVEPATGRELWRQEYDYNVSTAASPVVHGDVVYVSAGYNVGAGAFTIRREGDGFTSELLWRRRNRLVNHWSTPVCKDGFLYGMFSFKEYGEGPLQCVELATGEVRWSTDGFGPGNCILVGDDVVALSDSGEVVLVEATPEAYREVARAEVLDGKCWSTPAFAGKSLYVRSTVEGARLDL